MKCDHASEEYVKETAKLEFELKNLIAEKVENRYAELIKERD